MNDLEFILTNSNINPNEITEQAKAFLKESVIPHYEMMGKFSSSQIICHTKTNEVRKLSSNNIISLLKSIF